MVGTGDAATGRKCNKVRFPVVYLPEFTGFHFFFTNLAHNIAYALP